jgi:DNA-directed RNA polymerase specialized sigma24 family protein
MSLIANSCEEDSVAFEVRFRRCYAGLRLIACRVLSTPEWVEQAVGNCWYTASRYCPRFETEGAFRSWLLRVLIDEALALVHQNQQTSRPRASLRIETT